MSRLTERRLFHLVLVAWLMVFFAPCSARSQVETSRVGAVIPNARVTVTNVEAGDIRDVKSDTSSYSFAANLLSGKEFYLSMAANSGPLALTLNAARLSALTGAILCFRNSIDKGGMA